jgi:hypothetical protein
LPQILKTLNAHNFPFVRGINEKTKSKKVKTARGKLQILENNSQLSLKDPKNLMYLEPRKTGFSNNYVNFIFCTKFQRLKRLGVCHK